MRILLPLLALFVVTSCVSAPPPPPARKIAPPSPVTALPPPAPLATDWRDWPQTPGDWRYRGTSVGSIASFGVSGPGLFALQCDRSARQLAMIRYAATGGTATIRTSSLSRTLAFAVAGDPSGGSAVALLSATDPLLDAIGFSRGRFVVEQPGRAPLVLPAWAEVERVIEDCRA